MITVHDKVPDDVSESEVMVPESSSQEINDDNVTPFDTISEPRVDLPENEDTAVSPLLVCSPPTVLRRSPKIRKSVVEYNCILKIWGKVV